MPTLKQIAASMTGAAIALFLYWLLSARPVFCEAGESPLVCVREWSDLFAVVAGAAVIWITIRGQRDERIRHVEAIDLANADKRNLAARTIVIQRLIETPVNRLDISIGLWRETQGERQSQMRRVAAQTFVLGAHEALFAVDSDEVKEARILLDARGFREIEIVRYWVKEIGKSATRYLEPESLWPTEADKAAREAAGLTLLKAANQLHRALCNINDELIRLQKLYA